MTVRWMFFLLLGLSAACDKPQPEPNKASAPPAEAFEDINAPKTEPLPVTRSNKPIPDWAQSIVLAVSGMTCQGCEQSINEALEKQEGIFRSEANHLNGSVKVHYDAQKVKPVLMANTINDLGYRTIFSKSDPDLKKTEAPAKKKTQGPTSDSVEGAKPQPAAPSSKNATR